MKKIIIILVVVAVAFVGWKYFSKKKGIKSHIPKTVKSIEVKLGEIAVKLEETGEVKPSKEVSVKSNVGGKLTHYFFEEGDFVKNGDVVCIIEPDFNQANSIYGIQSDLKLAQINLKNTEATLKKKQKLFEKNFISKDEIDNAVDQFEKAKISYHSAKKKAELIQDIDADKNEYSVVADANGTIIQKPVEVGEMVVSSVGSYNSGTVLVKLADLKKVIVDASITEVDISKVYKGQKAEITVDAFPYEKFSGEIRKISAMAISENGIKVFPMEIVIDEVNKKLRPGMTANVTIFGEVKKEIVVIPIRAIFSDSEGNDIVYKVQNDTISGSAIIKTGINDLQKVEIIEGLNAGDKISLSEGLSTFKMKNGSKKENRRKH
ncbi:MAG: efflux RND transporter periplasmic adaptor subunit [Candidatus Cloacimonadota bacterium]|nr:efflux RND transporter periplasmic adaptor subunit [Candidatus Cloacimonadota bacterium]